MTSLKSLLRFRSKSYLFPFNLRQSKTYATEATVEVPEMSEWNVARTSQPDYPPNEGFTNQAFKLYNIDDEGPAIKATITAADGLKYYQTMTEIRRMESTLAQMYQTKLVRGFLHLYAGEEAIAVGMKSVMRDYDSIVTGYRCHAWALLMGSTVRSILAELAGRITGPSQGKGGSMHMYAKNFYGGHGIVGAQVPVGAGVALAHLRHGKGGVSIACYGDGAANQGQVFEAYNMSKLWNLPVIYVCENNLYAMGTARGRGAANPEFFTRCEYIPGIWVDAMNVLAVREATRYAVRRASSGKGPIILEMHTYRYYGHSMADPGISYRSREEVQKMRATRDPIEMLKNILLKCSLATEDQFKKIDAEVKKKTDEAHKTAIADKEPPHDQLSADVMLLPLEKGARGVAPWDTHKFLSSRQPVNL